MSLICWDIQKRKVGLISLDGGSIKFIFCAPNSEYYTLLIMKPKISYTIFKICFLEIFFLVIDLFLKDISLWNMFPSLTKIRVLELLINRSAP